MSNLGSMTTYISKRLIDTSNTAVSVPDVQEGINNSIRYWKFRRFWFNEANDTSTLTANSNAFPYPSDFLVPVMQDDGFCIEYSGIRYPLIKIEEAVYDGLYIENGLGLPRWYARTGSDEYRCYPIPNINYTVRRHYLRDYTDLVNDNDTNDFTNYASRLINLWTLADLTSELRQDDTDMGEYYRNAAMDEWRQLRVMTNKANSAGKVTLYSDLMTGVY